VTISERKGATRGRTGGSNRSLGIKTWGWGGGFWIEKRMVWGGRSKGRVEAEGRWRTSGRGAQGTAIDKGVIGVRATLV